MASVATWQISIVKQLEDGAFGRSSIYYPAWQPNFAGTQIGYSIHNKRLNAVVNVCESDLRDPAADCDLYLILKSDNEDAAYKSLDLQDFLIKRLPWEGGLGDMFEPRGELTICSGYTFLNFVGPKSDPVTHF